MTCLLTLAGVSRIAWPFLVALVIFVGSWLVLMWLALGVGNRAARLEAFRQEAQAVAAADEQTKKGK